MGMYTEFNIGVSLSDDVPQSVIDILRYMTGDINEIDSSVENLHPFFKTERWAILFKCDSYYFDGETHTSFHKDDIDNKYHLTVRSNLKNYDNEIELFLDFINPYLDTFDFLGYMIYEEDRIPTLIFRSEKGIELFYPFDDAERYRSLDDVVNR